MEKRVIFNNLIWRFAERCGAQFVKLIVELVLARLLLPDDYGTISLVTVIIIILNVFVDSGLGNALIQKVDADEEDFSTAFYFNIVWCIVIYIALFAASPLIAHFYNKSELTVIIRVLGITILISGVKNVQQAYVSRKMLFKKFFFATLGGTIGAAFVGIGMAYMGYGVWTLVFQQLFNTLVDTVILWMTVKWRPVRAFSIKKLKILFSFGWKLLASGLIDTIYTNIRALVIGKLYLPESLAYYNQGEKFPNLVVSNINNSIDSVLLPAMSREQDDRIRVKNMTRNSIKVSTYIMAPLMIGIAVAADSIVCILLTDKWLPCVFFLRIFCITYMFQPIHTANLNAIKALGRSDLFLKLEVYKNCVGIVLLLSTMFISVKALAYSSLVSAVTSQLINSGPNKKLLGYGYAEQLKDIFPNICIALIMGVIIYPITYMQINIFLKLLIQIILGIMIYIIESVILKIDSFYYIKNLLYRKNN